MRVHLDPGMGSELPSCALDERLCLPLDVNPGLHKTDHQSIVWLPDVQVGKSILLWLIVCIVRCAPHNTQRYMALIFVTSEWWSYTFCCTPRSWKAWQTVLYYQEVELAVFFDLTELAVEAYGNLLMLNQLRHGRSRRWYVHGMNTPDVLFW